MLKTLVKKQLMEIFRSWFYNSKKNKKRSAETVIAFAVLFVLLMAGVMGGMFALLSLVMCETLAEVGMSWFYFVADQSAGGTAWRFWKRVQYVFQSVSGKRQ